MVRAIMCCLYFMANVLLVDDDGSVLLTLAIALRRYGHTVTVACDANQALLQLRRHHFTFLISDVRMPGMSGIELAVKARRLAHAPRVILTSAYSNIKIREGIVEAFVQKPVDTAYLNSLLSTDAVPGGVEGGEENIVRGVAEVSESRLRPPPPLARPFCGQAAHA